MNFEHYLRNTRRYGITHEKVNPYYADELERYLSKYLKTVENWINGKIDRKAMAEVLNFFDGRYSAKGVKIYRGTKDLVFDGKPASYTKSLKVAEGFAIAEAENNLQGKREEYFVISRVAPARSLDFFKLLESYATCRIPRCEEQEVVMFNTSVSNNSITEYVI